MKYKLGDRVVCVECLYNNDKEVQVGETGTVCKTSTLGNSVGVRWDSYKSHRHSCDGTCEYGHGWFVMFTLIQPYTEDFDDPSTLSSIDDIM